jgi:GTPase SAR1 family protein
LDLLGSGGFGKTTILKSHTTGTFLEQTTTIGVEFETTVLVLASQRGDKTANRGYESTREG